jgi:Tfp pilus assembly protein PilF
MNARTRARNQTSLGANDIEIKDKWELIKQPDGTMAYYHALTGRWSWMSQDDAARKVQKRFRKSHSSDFAIQTNQLARTIHMLRNVGKKYTEDPTSLVAVVNYAIFHHAITRDAARAKELYTEALALASRNAVVNYGYGLLLLSGGFYPRPKMWEKAQEHLEMARLMDVDGKGFKIAEDLFFRWALVEQPKNVQALVNFALVQQCINKDMLQADIYYRRAINIDSSNEIAIINYRDFQRVKDGLYGYA